MKDGEDGSQRERTVRQKGREGGSAGASASPPPADGGRKEEEREELTPRSD